MAPVEPLRARSRARVDRPLVLAEIVAGASLEEIAGKHKLTPKRVEKLLCDELRRRWVPPAQDHARIQIARLEGIAAKLKTNANKGDLPTIDRLLRVLDRLDRYHGFTKLTETADAAPSEDVREQLIAKINQGLPATPDADA